MCNKTAIVCVATINFLVCVCTLSGCHVRNHAITDVLNREDEDHLTLELYLSADQYKTSESIDATLVLRNEGKETVQFPMIEGLEKMIFFDFLIIGSMGTKYLTDNSDGWYNPSFKDVKTVQLRPRQSYSVDLKNIIPLWKSSNFGAIVNETYNVFAIYQDHSHGHALIPGRWQGVVISRPAHIRQIALEFDK